MKKVKANERGLVKRKTAEVEVLEAVEDELYKNVRSYIAKARKKVYAVANTAMLDAYWNVGREIVEKQGGAERSKYGDGLIGRLALKLTAEFGRGYTSTNLKYMRLVYQAFPNRHTLCDQLTWSHYRTLACIEKSGARRFYALATLCNDGALAVGPHQSALDGEGAAFGYLRSVVTHACANIYVSFGISNEIDDARIKVSLHPFCKLQRAPLIDSPEPVW